VRTLRGRDREAVPEHNGEGPVVKNGKKVDERLAVVVRGGMSRRAFLRHSAGERTH
jgi:hypothetical protein